MEVPIEDSLSSTASCSPGYKRKKVPSEGKYDMRGVLSASIHKRNELKRRKTLLESPFALPDLYNGEGESIYGSAAKAIAALQARRMEVLSPKIKMKPVDTFQDVKKNQRDCDYGLVASAPLIIILDSDEEDTVDQRDCVHQQIILEKLADEPHRDNLMAMDVKSQPQIDTWDASDETEIINDEGAYVRACDENKALIEKGSSLATEILAKKDVGISTTMVEKEKDGNVTDYIEGDEENDISTTMVEKEEKSCREADGLDDIWMEFELSKEAILDQSSYEISEEDCDHTFILKDDIGEVCRVCGLVKRNIENILDFQYKVNRSSRTYMSTSQKNMNKDPPK